jgi:hypothetical protein
MIQKYDAIHILKPTTNANPTPRLAGTGDNATRYIPTNASAMQKLLNLDSVK